MKTAFPSTSDKSKESDIINEIEQKYTELKMDKLPVDKLSTHDIRLTCAFIGKDPMSHMYGKIIGFFNKDDTTYRFVYHVHRPHQRSPHLSNKMTEIDKITFKNDAMIPDDTDFGAKAFWEHTSMAYLQKYGNETDIMLRQLMIKITEYSKKHNLCEQFRKTDKIALAKNPAFQE